MFVGCVGVCMYIHTCKCAYVNVCGCVDVRTNIQYMHVCVCVCVCVVYFTNVYHVV